MNRLLSSVFGHLSRVMFRGTIGKNGLNQESGIKWK